MPFLLNRKIPSDGLSENCRTFLSLTKRLSIYFIHWIKSEKLFQPKTIPPSKLCRCENDQKAVWAFESCRNLRESFVRCPMKVQEKFSFNVSGTQPIGCRFDFPKRSVVVVEPSFNTDALSMLHHCIVIKDN